MHGSVYHLDSMFHTVKPSRFYLQLLILGRWMLNQLAQYEKGTAGSTVRISYSRLLNKGIRNYDIY